MYHKIGGVKCESSVTLLRGGKIYSFLHSGTRLSWPWAGNCVIFQHAAIYCMFGQCQRHDCNFMRICPSHVILAHFVLELSLQFRFAKWTLIVCLVRGFDNSGTAFPFINQTTCVPPYLPTCLIIYTFLALLPFLNLCHFSLLAIN